MALPGPWVRAALQREVPEAPHRRYGRGAIGLAVVQAVAIVVEGLHGHLIHPVQLAPDASFAELRDAEEAGSDDFDEIVDDDTKSTTK